MKQSEKLVRTTSFVAGGIAVAVCIFLILLVLLAELGMIFPRLIPLVIQTESVSEEYSGKPITGDLYISHGRLAEGHELEVLHQTELTNVGSVDNVIEYRIVDETGADVTERYDITLKQGKLTISPLRISIRTPSAKKPYDGTPLSAHKFTTISGNLCQGHRIEVISGAEQLTIGSCTNHLELRIYDKDDKDVTDQYELSVLSGLLEVTRIPLAITTESAEKEYDGTPLEKQGIRKISGSWLKGHLIEEREKTTFDGIGKVSNTSVFRIVDSERNDVSDLYDLDVSYGTLTVKKRKIHIQTASAEKVYDGTPLSADYHVISGSLCEGHSLYIKSQTSFTEPSVEENRIEFGIMDSNGKDVTDCYDIRCTYGKLNVRVRVIHIETESVMQEYDGKPVGGQYEMTIGSLCDGHSLYLQSADYIGTVSTGKNVVSVGVLDADGGDVTHCYKISYNYGTVSLSPRSITIQMADAEGVCNGENVYNDSYTILSGSLCEGHTLTVTGTREKRVGVFCNDMVSYRIVAVDENGRTSDVSSFYRVSYRSGTITIRVDK